MGRTFKMQTKISLVLVAMVTVAVSVVGYLSFVDNRSSTLKSYSSTLKLLADNKSAKIEALIREMRACLNILVNHRELQDIMAAYANNLLTDDEVRKKLAVSFDALAFGFKSNFQFEDIEVLNTSGWQLYSTYNTKNLVFNQLSEESFEHTWISPPDPSGVFRVTMPVKNRLYQTTGIVSISFNIKYFLDFARITSAFLANKINNLEIIVLDSDSIYKIFSSQLTYKEIPTTKSVDNPLFSAFRGSTSGIAVTSDTYNYFTANQSTKWFVVASASNGEINKDIGLNLVKSLTFSTIIIFSIALIATVFSRFILRPILVLQQTLRLLSQGILPKQIPDTYHDEVGDMIIAVNSLIANLEKNASFAHSIGLGNFDTDFKPVSPDDVLGNALMAMRDSLRQSNERDEARNWITRGVAEFGQILRFHDNIADLSYQMLTYVCERLHAIQGAVYIIHESDNQITYKLTASYAYHKKKLLRAEFQFAQGLVGQCAAEKDFIIRSEVPDDYFFIRSGILNDTKPKYLVFCPLIDNDKVFGVIELAFFHPFRPVDKEFMKEIALIAARAIYSLRVNEMTLKLLEEARNLSNELQMNQEVLREQAVTMQQTQKQLQITNMQLEEQIQEVRLTQKRTQLLLENASEIVVIYEADRKIRYISPSVSVILGYNPSQMIDTYDEVNITVETRHFFVEMFQKILENPDKKQTTQYRYQKSNGEYVWLEATGINLLHDDAIHGIVVNIRDITERLRAESEERMRSRMQSLSENSPDIIARLNPAKEFFYINPAIQALGNYQPSDFLGKTLYEAPIERTIREKWDELIDSVLVSKVKKEAEINFMLKGQGEKTVIVKVIPEFNENQEVESVLLVSHDISDIKLREIELQVSNKKIKESINYAKRIQQTIIPDSQVFDQFFADSFVLYKPRDVVSGDFPWIFQKGHSVFFAAVDCTGHGVPGALMSLIGYFALNDIVASSSEITCGKVLDLLHEKVTRAMRQDSGSPSNDGMDIALCCYDLVEKKLSFAGAHRPLLAMLNGNYQEIRGDKPPIGGSQYHTRQPYHTHEFFPKPGDTIYLLTDGLTDQFGGNFDKKFGNQKLRELLKSNRSISMKSFGQIIDNEFESWKGSNTQTDDMLMIGIRF